MKILLRTVILILGVGFLVVVMAWQAGWFTEKIDEGYVAPPSPEKGSAAVTVNMSQEPVIETAPGTIRAKNETSISSRITARLISLNVRAGDSVEEGQTIATLDDRDLTARVQQAREGLRGIEAQIENARAEYDRMKQLVDQGAAAQSSLDAAQATLRSLEANAEQARRGVDEAEASLSYAIIKAPMAGRVVDRYAEPGDIISPGMAIVRLYDPASLRLEADVRESIATKLHRGDKLEVRIDALDKTYESTVDEIVPQSDAGSRSFIVKVTLPNSEGLYPGMFGRLMIPTGSRERLYIPSTAIARVGQLEYVYVLENSSPVRRYIKAADEVTGKGVAVLSGLKKGEMVVEKAASE